MMILSHHKIINCKTLNLYREWTWGKAGYPCIKPIFWNEHDSLVIDSEFQNKWEGAHDLIFGKMLQENKSETLLVQAEHSLREFLRESKKQYKYKYKYCFSWRHKFQWTHSTCSHYQLVKYSSFLSGPYLQTMMIYPSSVNFAHSAVKLVGLLIINMFCPVWSSK